MSNILPPIGKRALYCPECEGCLCSYDCYGCQCECDYFPAYENHILICEGCMQCWPIPELEPVLIKPTRETWQQREIRLHKEAYKEPK